MAENLENLSIRDLLDIAQFKIIQNELASLVDISIVTTDTEGIPIGELSNFTTFCQLVRSSPVGRKNCEECDRVASLRALREGKALVYDCHCGLKDCTAPILVDGAYVGSVLGGQVVVREEDRTKINTKRISLEFGLPRDQLEQRVGELKVVPEEYLHRSLRFYSFLANYSAESGVKNLIQKKLEKEREELVQLQQIAKEQELKRMQAQMNPHFLFNALNSIARIAYLEESSQTEQLIYSLSNYLRYSIKNTETMPNLSLELENLNYYLSIQNTRFGDRIHFSVEIDPDILDWRIPSMTLQPIVENAINHGLENKKEGGYVTVIGKRSHNGREIVLTIYDNGVGFPPGMLEQLERKDDRGMASPQLGLGLRNTHERIKRLYGEEYGLRIDSVPDEYSRVSIRLPKYVGDQNV
jgi:LytS/YehU family sensor histidine kinase